jgi:hypothetical protein
LRQTQADREPDINTRTSPPLCSTEPFDARPFLNRFRVWGKVWIYSEMILERAQLWGVETFERAVEWRTEDTLRCAALTQGFLFSADAENKKKSLAMFYFPTNGSIIDAEGLNC